MEVAQAALEKRQRTNPCCRKMMGRTKHSWKKSTKIGKLSRPLI